MAETSARLLKLLSLLQARRDWPGHTLADRLGVSGRTVRRDVDRLRELGYPVEATKGPDGGYRLDAGSELPPLLFDDEQAVAVAIALRTARVPGVEEAAVRALATFRQVMPARLRARLDALEVTAVPRTQKEREAPPVDPGVLLELGSAIRAREVLRFDYDGGSSEVLGTGDQAFRPPRRVEPHHLVTWGGRWYLVAYDVERDDWRTFRVDRMTPRSPTGPRFMPRHLPAPDVTAFIAERFTRPPSPVQGQAVLQARAADVAPWVGPDGTVEALSDDEESPRCRVTMGSWDWDGLAAQLAMFGVPFEVADPEELHDAVVRLAERLQAAAAASKARHAGAPTG